MKRLQDRFLRKSQGEFVLNILFIETKWDLERSNFNNKNIFKVVSIRGLFLKCIVLLKLREYAYLNSVLGIHFPCSCEHFQGRCR